MNASQIVSAVTGRGYQLTHTGGKIKYSGTGGLPSDLLTKLREHKQAVLIHLAASDKLTTLADELGWPQTDLLDFYQNDMTDIERMSLDEVRFIVRDYITNYTACRDIPNAELFKRSREVTQ